MKIQNITDKSVNTKFGPKAVYSVMADGEWYKFGFKKPAFKIGDDVEFTFTEGQYGKDVDAGSVRVITSAAAGAAPTTPAAPAPQGRYTPPGRPFPIPLLHGDRAIIRQNALTNARELFMRHYELEDLVNGPHIAAEQILTLARLFEEYSAGDVERRAAEEE